MGLDRAPIEFQTFYFFHVWLDPPNLRVVQNDPNYYKIGDPPQMVKVKVTISSKTSGL